MNPYVGIEIGVTSMYMYAQTEQGIMEQTVPTGSACTFDSLKQHIRSFIEELPSEPAGVGIGLVGLVEGDQRVQFSDMNILNGITADQFTDGKVPVKLLNDVKAAAIAETRPYRNNRTAAFILADAGIASQVVVDGKQLQGACGWSGELGYMMVPVSGRVKKLDDLASSAAILREARVSAEVFMRKLEKHDAQAASIIQQAGFYFGIALTNVIHLYNPDVIVIGGAAAQYPGYLERAITIAAQYTLQDLFQACRIEMAREGHRSVAIGASEYAREQLACI